MVQRGRACCAAGTQRAGPCEWNCAGRCDFHRDFTVKVGCAAADAAPRGGCRQGWGRALCSCTDACSTSIPEHYLPQPLSAPSPRPLLASGSAKEGEAAGGGASLYAMDMGRSSIVAVPFGQLGARVSVRPGPPGTLQAAVDAAAPGATLVLEDGDYTGNTSIGCVLSVSKSITIRARNTGRAVLDGEGKWRVVDLSGGDVALQGLNITGGKVTGDRVRLAASKPCGVAPLILCFN